MTRCLTISAEEVPIQAGVLRKSMGVRVNTANHLDAGAVAAVSGMSRDSSHTGSTLGLALANAVAPRAQAQEQAQAPRAPAPELTEQQRLRAQSPGGPLTPGVELPRWREQPSASSATTVVTDEMLANPSPNDWLSWRRTQDGLGFSPLTSINKNNVADLQLAWSLALPPGPNTATPLVHDGVIYVHSFGDHVQALDAATGDELWHYARTLPSTARPTVKRNMALYGDRIYFGTSDVHVVALDARTGDGRLGHANHHRRQRLRLERRAARGARQGHARRQRAGAGRRLHRRARCASPAPKRGASTRSRAPASPAATVGTACRSRSARAARSGRPAATTPSAISRSSARRRPTTRGRCATPTAQRGVTNEALYTNATIALNPDTGALVWHFQHVPNDQWDFDWAFERQLVKLPIDGRERSVLVTAGKEADLRRARSRRRRPVSVLASISGCRTSSRKSIRAPARKRSIRSSCRRARARSSCARMRAARRAGCRHRSIRARRSCSCRSSSRAWT